MLYFCLEETKLGWGIKCKKKLNCASELTIEMSYGSLIMMGQYWPMNSTTIDTRREAIPC